MLWKMSPTRWFKVGLRGGFSQLRVLDPKLAAHLFVAVAWHIWLARNDKVFNDKQPSISLVLFESKILCNDLSSAFGAISSPAVTSTWKPPAPGWVKLNTDGGTSQTKQISVIGGVCRDADGGWLWGYNKRVEFCDPAMAEAKGLLAGLEFARERRIPRLEVESDCLLIIQILRNEASIPHPEFEDVLKKWYELLHMPWEIKVSWTGRKGNICADDLAKLSYDNGGQEFFWDLPPLECLEFLKLDSM
ncbi:hypothetical protein OROMI_032829 [Orobanche minor]